MAAVPEDIIDVSEHQYDTDLKKAMDFVDGVIIRTATGTTKRTRTTCMRSIIWTSAKSSVFRI